MYRITVEELTEKEVVERIYVTEDEADKMGLEKKSGYVPKAFKKEEYVKIYEQKIEDLDVSALACFLNK